MLNRLTALFNSIKLKIHSLFGEDTEIFYVGGSDNLPAPLTKQREDEILA